MGGFCQDLAAELENKASSIEWEPLPGPQSDAFYSEADELLYGGAAGGGKTDLLLGLALKAHLKSIIFRRELQQMKGAKGIIARSEEIIEDRGSLNRSEYVWRGLPSSRSLEFGSVPHWKDRNRYKGRPHDLKAFDELTEFTRELYRFLIAWCRTTDPGQRTRVVATCNPPTDPEGEWVIEEWAPWLDDDFEDPAAPGELRWYVYDENDNLRWFHREELDEDGFVEVDGERREPSSRTFIPALLEDNPHLANGDYRRRLDTLPEPLRSKLKLGDWSAGTEDDPWQIIPTAWVRLAQKRWKRLHEEGFTPEVPLTALGVDPSRGGKDDTSIAPRYGNYVAELITFEGQQIPDGPAAAAQVLKAHEGEALAIVDVIGIGSSVYDNLKDVIEAVPFGASGGSKAKDKSGKFGFLNLRAEVWWKMRERLDPSNGEEIALPDSRRLRADLCAPRYSLTVRGIKVEDKEKIKERLGRSPDCGDAVVMAFYEPATLDFSRVF